MIDDDFGRAIEPLRSSLKALVDAARAEHAANLYAPAAGSPAAIEREHDSDYSGGALGHRPITGAHHGAGTIQAAAEDHLLGLTAMLEIFHPPFAHHPPARAALENSARVAHLLEADITLPERLIRWTNERLYSVTEHHKLTKSPELDQTGRKLLRDAVAAGLPQAIDKKGNPLPWLDPPRRTATDLVAQLLLDDGTYRSGFGEVA